MAGKWNYETHEYDVYDLPRGAAVYSSDMDKIINCAGCGKAVAFGDTYTSFEIHDEVGFGYGVCAMCHAEEVKRSLETKEAEDDPDEEVCEIDVYRVKIENLNLSPRTYRCLKRAGIDTVGELCSRRYDRVKCIRGIGKKTLDELTDKMRELGVWFKES